MPPRKETSADTAARFLAMRRGQTHSPVARRVVPGPGGRLPPRTPRRIAVDFAEPTLRLVHEVLLDAMHANVDFSDRGALLLIAEQMIAIALGDPPCDDPPLTDREVR